MWPEVKVPPGIEAAITVVLTAAAGYFTPPNGFMGERRIMPDDPGTSVAILLAAGLTLATVACTPSGQINIPILSDPRASWKQDCGDWATSLKNLAPQARKMSDFEVRLVDQQNSLLGPLCPPRRDQAPTSVIELQTLSRSVATLRDLEKEVARR
jgi:hypothetical protein